MMLNSIYKSIFLKTLNNKLIRINILLFAKRKFLNSKKFLYFKDFKNLKTENDGPSQNILLAGTIGANNIINNFEKLLYNSLASKNNVYKLVCDKTLNACLECTYLSIPKLHKNSNSKKICTGCFSTGQKVNHEIQNSIRLSQFLDENNLKYLENFKIQIFKLDLNELITLKVNDINLGEHAKSATLRYLAVGELKDNDKNINLLRKFLYSSELIRIATTNIQRKFKFDVVVLLHGMYVPHGVLNDVFKSLGVRTVIWNQGYRNNSFIFSHGETYHKTLLNESNIFWENSKLEILQKQHLLNYLESRISGDKDWISFNHKNEIRDYTKIANLINKFTFSKTYLLLTNVSWDAQVHYDQNIFKNMWEWIEFTLNWFKNSPDNLLVIRVHPAEVTSVYPSQERIHEKIISHFGELPHNILVIPSHDKFSTYALSKMLDKIIIYGTKMGIELAPLGKKIIVCGESWIKNKKIVNEIKSKNEYLNVLNAGYNLRTDIDRAQKFAYYYFFQRLIELPKDNHPLLEKNLNVIIDGILNGRPFVLPLK